jgi:hypothetical protein
MCINIEKKRKVKMALKYYPSVPKTKKKLKYLPSTNLGFVFLAIYCQKAIQFFFQAIK